MTGNRVFVSSVTPALMNVMLNKTVYDGHIMDSSELKQNGLYYIHAWGEKYKFIDDKPSAFCMAWNKINGTNKKIPEKLIDPKSMARKLRKKSRNEESSVKKSLVKEAKGLIIRTYTDMKEWAKSSEEAEKLCLEFNDLHKQLLEQVLMDNKEKDLELVLNIMKEMPVLIGKIRKDDIQAKVRLAEMYKAVKVSTKLNRKTMPPKVIPFLPLTKSTSAMTCGSRDKLVLERSLSKFGTSSELTKEATEDTEVKETTAGKRNARKSRVLSKQKVTTKGLLRLDEDGCLVESNEVKVGLTRPVKKKETTNSVELIEDDKTKKESGRQLETQTSLVNANSSAVKEKTTKHQNNPDANKLQRENELIDADEKLSSESPLLNILTHKQKETKTTPQRKYKSINNVQNKEIPLNHVNEHTSINIKISPHDNQIHAELSDIEKLEETWIQLSKEQASIQKESTNLSNTNAQLVYQYNNLCGMFQEEATKDRYKLFTMEQALNGKRNEVKRVRESGIGQELNWKKQLKEIANSLEDAVRIHVEQNSALEMDIAKLRKEQTKLQAMLNESKEPLTNTKENAALGRKEPCNLVKSSTTVISEKEISPKTPKPQNLSLIHICRCRRIERCRSRWSPYH
eukprot:TRINITY_DN8283_c0_g1_i1.p1 TRINITY_DN8283_c0_g1~~TRINITY_DN8283_c0_g1_i1.p1  ORF type:complete len:627 (-),score=129.98 TRINITY_DN8283_c0_g1_i1:17-1897(-)